jgi:hypothetical protein
MTAYTDWLPGARTEQIEMAKNRIQIFTASPEEWKFPPAELARFLTKVPARPEDLPMIIDENRKTHSLNLRVDDTGKTFYYSGCCLNSAHEEGPYCPIQSRLIP